MVQEIENSSVPDELYNLTQLAEVTLAAGKLSTTNIHQIKSYIQQTSDIDRNYYNTNDYYPAYPTPVFIQKVSDVDEYKSIPVSSNWDYWTDNGSIDSQYYLPQSQSTWQKHENSNTKSVITHSVIKYDKRSNKDETQSINGDTTTSSSSLSSDDDSIFSYSHKIFDRKKSRGTHVISPPLSSSDDQREECNLVGVIIKAGKDEKSEESHICPECGKKYSTSSNLARHRQTHRYVKININKIFFAPVAYFLCQQNYFTLSFISFMFYLILL